MDCPPSKGGEGREEEKKGLRAASEVKLEDRIFRQPGGGQQPQKELRLALLGPLFPRSLLSLH